MNKCKKCGKKIDETTLCRKCYLKENKKYTQDIKELVIERIKTMPSNYRLSIG